MADEPQVGEKTLAQPGNVPKGPYGPFPPFGTTNCTGVPGEAALTMNPANASLYPYYDGGTAGHAGEGFAPFDQPSPGTYELYRRIARTPTVAIGLSVPVSRTINNEWSWKKRDKVVPDLHVDLLQRWFDSQRPQIVRDGTMALRFGFAPFEKVYELVDPAMLGLEAGEKWMLPRLKPLRVDYTHFLADASMRKLTGLRNQPPHRKTLPDEKPYTDLMLDKCFWYTFGGESGDPYGESLFENIREVWSEADQVRKKIGRYTSKISGVIGQVHFPSGNGRDASGAAKPNYELAKQLAAAGSRGEWLLMENRFASFIVDPQNVSPAALEKALAAAGKAEWVVSFIDPGGTDHATGFKELLQYYDVLMVRGLLQPERSLLESQGSGSRADSQTHGLTGVLFPEVLITDFVLNFNKHVVDDILEMNVGPEARGTVYAVPDPIADDEYDAKLKTIHAMLQNPDTSAGVSQKIDIEQNMDDLGIHVLDDERGKPLDILSQILSPALKIPGRNGNTNTNAPVGRTLGVRP